MSVSSVLDALGDPTRRQMMAFLSEGEASVSQIAEEFPISQPAISST